MTDQENNILWNSYLYPNTNILINKFNIKDYNKLKEIETTYTFEKLLKLRQEPLDIEIDKNRLNNLHKYLFEEIYPFAGEYRKVNMIKSRGTFLFINEPKDIDENLNELFDEINEMKIHCHNKIDFCNILAKLYTSLIFIHPYREGNGRTIREFIREYSIKYSEKLGIGQMELDWSAINKEKLEEYIDVVHLFPNSISSVFMDALVPNTAKPNIKKKY